MAKKGTWWFAISLQTASRDSNGIPASQRAIRASKAPFLECPGCPIAPVTGSITVVLYLAISCKSAAIWYSGAHNRASTTILGCFSTHDFSPDEWTQAKQIPCGSEAQEVQPRWSRRCDTRKFELVVKGESYALGFYLVHGIPNKKNGRNKTTASAASSTYAMTVYLDT